MSPAPTISTQPIDDLRCKFILDRPVVEGGTRKFLSPDEAADVPVVAAVLEVPAICEVVVSGNVITAIQDGTLPWTAIDPQVRYAIDTTLAQVAVSSLSSSPGDDDEAFDIIEEVFNTQVNPAVAQHGGKIELIDMQDMTVVVRMMGGCQGCGMANVTLRQGIEETLKRQLPGIQGVKDITDHASGTDPYFQSEKK